ncbi:MAG: Holliday junction resolvase RuvX [Calditrichaeota bacterium]|nr:Holliday junction resolvase RuvX [Calditrichota bacterium]MCB9391554.1 Holliday junction resolvase RuvX [Calditrichota bacterium]
MSRVLGLDWGTRRIGVAISDEARRLAVGLAVWPADESSFSLLLAKTIREDDITLIVVGLPVSLKGEEGASAAAARKFAERVAQTGVPVELHDERFTSYSASTALSQIGISQRKQRGKLDMAAAVMLLQSFLDERNRT